MKIAVTFPVFVSAARHKELIEGFLPSIVSQQHELVVIPVINYQSPDFEIQYPGHYKVVTARHPQSVARGWNTGIEEALAQGCEYILVANTDIVLRHDAIDMLVQFAEEHPEAVLWSAGEYPDLSTLQTFDNQDRNFTEHPSFSCFLIHKSFFEKMGKFDENYRPAYFEDNDMHARIALSNNKAYIYGGARFFHYGSQTINSDPSFRMTMPPLFEQNRSYFISKWGCAPVNEVDDMRARYWKNPFSNPAFDHRYTRPAS